MEELKLFFEDIEERIFNGFGHSFGEDKRLDENELAFIDESRTAIVKQLEKNNLSDKMRTYLNERLTEYDKEYMEKSAKIKATNKSKRLLTLKISGIGVPTVVALTIISKRYFKH